MINLQQNEVSAHGVLEHIIVWANNAVGVVMDGNDESILYDVEVYNSINVGTGIHWNIPSGSEIG